MNTETKDLDYTYKGQTLIIKAVKGDYCPHCGESIHNTSESQRISAEILAFHQHVNAQNIEPSYILQMRQKLNLSQKEASAIFGGGVNAFSRYETGKATPPLSLIKLFKILEKHPEHLAEIR